MPEIARVLQPGGWFTVLWNVHQVGRDPALAWTYRTLHKRIPTYRYVDRSTWARRAASRLYGKLPTFAHRALGLAAQLTGDPGRISKGLQLQSTGHFGRVIYLEQEHCVPVDREGFVNLWRTRNRLRDRGAAGKGHEPR